FSCVFQMRYSGFDHDAPGDLLLAGRSGRSGQAEGPDEGRKRDPLQNEGDANDAKRKKNDQVPMWERTAVGQHSRKGKGGSERDNASHTSPADDKNLASAWRLLVLVGEPGSQEVGKSRTREDPNKAKQNEQDAKDQAVQK